MSTIRFSSAKESVLLEDFCVDQTQMTTLERFCQLYRDLTYGASFLNEAQSTRWLSIWKAHNGPGNRKLERTLSLVKSWTGRLFDQGQLDNNVYYYIHCARFLRGAEPALNLEVNLQRSIQRYFQLDNHLEECADVTKRLYRGVLHDFNRFLGQWPGACKPGSNWAVLESQELLVEWQQSQCQRVESGRNLGSRLRLLRDFMEFLKNQDHISSNPVALFLEMYPRGGWRGVATAVGSANPQGALDALLPRAHFDGPWGPQMLSFIRAKRSMGADYDFEERTLRQLDRYCAAIDQPALESITPAILQGWLDSLTGVNAHTQNTKFRVAKDFFDHLVRHGFAQSNPACARRHSRRRRTGRAFIYSKEQLQSILGCARQLHDIPFFANRGATYEMVFSTLYALGLRVSEACRLSLEDVDLDQGLILIRESKFYKSRLLPVAPKYLAHLARFMELKGTNAGQTPLFKTRDGHRINRASIGNVFRNIVTDLRLTAQPGQRGPCLHAFRHSFAVHRLVRWYRDEEDVQTKLPLLSAYLGHLDISSTQVYLEATNDMLDAANQRFEDRFGYVTGFHGIEVLQ